jgi:imidazolonepropionase-like amidohydrolase
MGANEYAPPMHRLGFLVALVACGGGKKAEPIRALAGDLVITDVTVVPMNRDTTIAHQTVIVRGDKIVAVAPADSVQIDSATERISGNGQWLMPGLVDMHVHFWNENDLTMFVAAGITTVRNMFGSEQHLAWRADIASGKRFGPAIVTASPILDGDPPVWPGSIVISKPEDADGIVAGLKGKGYDFLKPYALLQKPAYEALVAAGKKHGMTLQGHVPKAVGLAAVVAAGQKSIEHLDGWVEALATGEPGKQPAENYWKTMARYVAAADETKIAALVDMMRKAGTWNCPTLIVTERMSRLDDVAGIEKQTKWLDLISPEIRATWNPNADFRLKSATPEDFAAMKKANGLRAKIVQQLAASGAPLLVGTDTGNPYVVPGEGMHDEIELLVAAGATRPRVMRAATADAGTFLGMPGTLGVVAPGARADLLLVSVDPMAQPLPLVPEGVVVRGKWIGKRDLEAKLEAIRKPAVIQDRFGGMPALAPEGTDVVQAHYAIKAGDGDKTVGEERLAVGRAGKQRVIVAQVVSDVPGRMEIAYRIAGQETSMSVKSSLGTIALAAKPEGGKLAATGTDVQGKPITTSEPITKDTFLAGPGIGGTIEMADKMSGMKVGEKRKAASLELAFFPNPHIEKGTYEIERKPDIDGKRAFTITYGFGSMTVASTLTLDDKGLPLRQVFGSPLDQTFVRE